jgi:hypothetical protein
MASIPSNWKPANFAVVRVLVSRKLRALLLWTLTQLFEAQTEEELFEAQTEEEIFEEKNCFEARTEEEIFEA